MLDCLMYLLEIINFWLVFLRFEKIFFRGMKVWFLNYWLIEDWNVYSYLDG